MEGIYSGVKAAFVDPTLLLHLPEDWLTKFLVLTSMSLQVLLIFVGVMRYRSMSRILSTVGWLAYICADAVAMSAMGLLQHSERRSRTGIFYAIWAPLLLLHLGGPDTITAYSMADNELWPRHGVTMLYHVSLAAYIIYTSAMEAAGGEDWYLLAAAVLVFIAGSSKYAERTYALWLASFSHIVSDALPIHQYMQHQHKIEKRSEEEWNYMVTGDDEFYDEFECKGSEFEWSRENLQRLQVVTLADVWEFEDVFYDEFECEGSEFEWSRENLQRLGIVTLADVWEFEGGITENYKLCAAYAFFRMYTARFASLSLPDQNLTRIPEFFVSPVGFATWVMLLEMKLIYDYLFTKSRGTAFSMCGTVVRVGNMCLLALACFLSFSRFAAKGRETDGHNGHEIVTYILMSVAVALEVLQLCRIIVSDWTMVWFISSYIRHFHWQQRSDCFMAKLMRSVMLVVNKLRGGDSNPSMGRVSRSIGQHSLIETCLSTSWLMWRFNTIVHIPDFIVRFLYTQVIVPFYINAASFSNSYMWESMWEPLFIYHSTNQHEVYDLLHKHFDLKRESMEVLIFAWHVATTICHRLDSKEEFCSGKEKIWSHVSIMMARYYGYLMVSCPEILPVHAVIAEMKYEQLCSDISGFANNRNIRAMGNYFWELLRDHESKGILGTATRLARHLLQKSREDRWQISCHFWGGLLTYCGFYSKAVVHADRLTVGGEVLTMEWVFLGHMGIGERSDSAVADRGPEWEKRPDMEEHESSIPMWFLEQVHRR